ncbi:YkvA family protein [Candidatus Nitronereus thalassa]|uniref:DUF1232 domain-containing protein n=1 Tax=Candidatus Nitronereus thalassa TaxID=3020898 RepID=A0ABU3K2X5_9BACT|nr:DUF1232 domain-containing protein [Candidatus Nitronereus thalassa]MDT7040744.1 DUF1232 domain-containing protein [Candidatus Nitronereus thalassa]
MAFGQGVKAVAKKFKREIKVYQLLVKDRRVPRLAKWFLAMAIGYTLSPIDLIIDSIPGLGFIDDFIIVPTLVIIALKLIPTELLNEYGNKVDMDRNQA